jgi:Secretion system C-terminal sorting domain
MKHIYKKLILIAILSLFNFTQAQTTLVAGDIAVVGYIGNGTVAGDDQFSFVLLKDITANTVIKFTDNGWLRTDATSGSWRTGEGIITWTSQSALATGTEVTIVFGSSITTTSRYQEAARTSGIVTGTALSLSANGDQVIAYQGTEASPTFITALHMNVYYGAILPAPAPPEPTTNEAIWCGNYNTANASGIPTGLTNGVNAMWIGVVGDSSSEKDNMRLTCGKLDLSTVAKIKAIVYNKANYTTSDNAPGFTIPTDCRFMDPALSDEDFDLNTKVSVYPNPFKNEINIKTNQNFETIEVYSVLGNKILSEKFKNSINTTMLTKGIYFLALVDEKGSKVSRKIIKE